MNKTNPAIEKTFALAYQNHQKNNLEIAENLYNEILKINPNHFESIFLLGTLSAQSKKFSISKQLLLKATQIQPNNIHVHNNLGNVLKELGEYQKAINCYEKVIQIDSNFGQAHNNLGVVQKELGEYQKAINHFHKAIQIDPNNAETHNNLGVVQKELGEYQKAIDYYEKAIKINPNNAETHNNFGVAQKELGEYQKAIDYYEKAIQINPNYAEAYYNLGNVQSFLGEYNEANKTYHQAIKIKSNYTKAYSNLLFNLNYKKDCDPGLFLEEAKKFRINCGPKKKLSIKYQHEKKPIKLKIGCVSADFGDHPGGYFSLSTLKELKKKQFELIAYETSSREDEFVPYFKPLFEKWHLIAKKKDNEVAEQIIKDGVHILIDLQGHSAKNRLTIFMYKPAPVQINWLGQGSTGIPEIDYIVGSPYLTPKNEENHYVEKIWRLPETHIVFTPPFFDVEINNLPALKNNFVTFGCINKLTKVNDEVIALWSKILLSIPNSKLLLKSSELDHQQIIKRTYERLNKCNIEKNRIILRGKSPTRKEVLEVYNEIDIALDPFPFQGCTCTCEAVWMGVPVIILKGNRNLFHAGESINSNLGMHDWIAKNHDEYVSKAIKFSSNIDQLSKIRINLRQTFLQSPVCDAPRFAEHFSKMLWDMWKKLNIL